MQGQVKAINQTSKSATPAFRQRVLLVAGITLFFLLFRWAYINWLFPIFAYYGFDYNVPPAKYLALACICSVLPSLWMPMEVNRPSHLTYWLLYLTVFIPSMIVPLFVRLSEPPDVARLILVLFFGFAIIGLSYLFPIHRVRSVSQPKSLFWYGFSFLTVVCGAMALISLRGNIHFVTFSEIYDVRDAAKDLQFGPTHQLFAHVALRSHQPLSSCLGTLL